MNEEMQGKRRRIKVDVVVPVTAAQLERNANPEDADFVDRVWLYLVHFFPMLLSLPADKVEDVKQFIREEERGERPYITPAGAAQRARQAEQILALFNGRNATEVARWTNSSRAKVYRVLKQAGRG